MKEKRSPATPSLLLTLSLLLTRPTPSGVRTALELIEYDINDEDHTVEVVRIARRAPTFTESLDAAEQRGHSYLTAR